MNITDEVMRCLRAGVETKIMLMEQGMQNHSSKSNLDTENDLLDQYFDVSEGVKFYTLHCDDNEIDGKYKEIAAKYKDFIRQQHSHGEQT